MKKHIILETAPNYIHTLYSVNRLCISSSVLYSYLNEMRKALKHKILQSFREKKL